MRRTCKACGNEFVFTYSRAGRVNAVTAASLLVLAWLALFVHLRLWRRLNESWRGRVNVSRVELSRHAGSNRTEGRISALLLSDARQNHLLALANKLILT
jgi:hypothetical protein